MIQSKTRALIANIITVCMLLTTIMPGVAAFADDVDSSNVVDSVTESVYGTDYLTDPDEYREWKENLFNPGPAPEESNYIMQALLVSEDTMYNDYIEAWIGSDGKFSIGTTGGNPNSATDNNKMLTYWHPGGTTSETLIRIDGSDYRFNTDSRTFNSNGTQCTSTGTVGGITVHQIISFERNAYTQRDDIVSIKYVLQNTSSTSKQIGGRIMLDTMLGDNDGAPFKVPGIGDVTNEREFVGSAIPQYWQAFDSLSDPGVVASGTFYRSEHERPDKVQFVAWPGIWGSSWDYTVSSGESVTGDSAVAAYFNPISVAAGQSRTIVTYYGMSDFAFGDVTGEIGARITAPSSLQANEAGTAYRDNPFTVTAYVANQTAGTLSNVQATLSLPAGLTLTGSQTATAQIGNLLSGSEKQVSWQVWAVPQSSAKTLNYSINVTSSTASKSVPMSISLPQVNYMTVDSLSLNRTSLAMTAGGTSTLVATIRTGTSSVVARKYEVRWETSNTRVAIVSSDGVVTAVGNGTATIKAVSADNRKTASCSVTVAARTTTEIDLWTLSDLAYHGFTNSDKGKTLSAIASSGTSVFGNWKAISSPTKTGHIKTVLGGFSVNSITNDDRTSFYGVSFNDLNNGIVIAYRGSNDPMIGWSGIGKDWLDDASFGAFDNLPEQFYQALQFYRQVKANNPGKTIRLTGHSLGGALAAFVSIMEDVEAVVFSAPSGLIIDLTYFINANYIDVFKGIDKWKFKNHYNANDLVGNRNPNLYRAVSHSHNNHNGSLPSNVNNAHNLESLVTVKDGTITFTIGSGENSYKYNDKWERVLDSFKNPDYGILSQLGMSSNQLNGGRLGRVMLGKSSGSQKLTFPDNLVEVRRNVMFMGGGSTTANGTSSCWGDYYYLSKSGRETVYGRNGDDIYVVFGKGNNVTWIYDSSGDDTIWYKDAALSEITVSMRSDGHYSVKAAGGTGSLVVDKNRGWFQPQIIIKDKNGSTKKINKFSGTGMAQASITQFSDETSSDNLRTVRINGSNITIQILDEDMVLLGTFDNLTDKIEITEYASVFMHSGTNPMIEVDLMNNGRFIKVSGNSTISYSVFDLSATGASTALYKLDNVDLSGNATLLVDNVLFSSGTGFTLTKNGADQDLIPSEFKFPSNIAAVPNNVEMYAGQNQTVSLTFTPVNVVSREVDIEVDGNSDSIFVMPNDDGTIDITALSEGDATIKASSPFDSNVSTTIPIIVLQDEAPQIAATTNGHEYSMGDWADEDVTVNIVLPAGYDKKFFNIGDGFQEAANGVVVNANGINAIYAYAQDSVNNKITKIAQLEVKYDDKAPEILNVQQDGKYYIDKCIMVHDENLDSVTVNDVALTQDELADGKWVVTPGQYDVIATDLSNKTTSVTFEIMSIPDENSLTVDDADLITDIRNEFEDDKYLLSDERREELSLTIYNLERKLSSLKNHSSSEADITGFNVDGQLDPEIIDPAGLAVMVSVRSQIDLTSVMPIIGISDGAQISPNPFEAQNFENPVTYTVTAADGTEKNWSVTIQTQVRTTKPVLQGVEIAGNSVALEFDDFMDSSITANLIELHRQNGTQINSDIVSHLVNEKVISLDLDIDFASLPGGDYYVLLKSNAVKNVDGLFNDEVSISFSIDGLSQVAAPTSSVSTGEVSKGTSVTLFSTTAETEIFYTTDGSTPTRDSNAYTSAIVIEAAITLKAIAVKSGMADSDIAAFRYTIASGSTTPDGGSSGSGGGGGGGSGGGGGAPTIPSSSFSEGKSIFTKGSGENLVLITQKDFSQHNGVVKIDGNTLTQGTHYQVESGSTRVIVFADYLETISAGEHTLIVGFKDGTLATAKFTIAEGDKLTPNLTERQNPFTDVISSDWFYGDVEYANANGLMVGTSPMQFSPGLTLTRGMVVMVLYRIAGSPDTSGIANPFCDVDTGKWYGDAVRWAAANGIVSGYGNNKFGSEDNITREQMAAILINYEQFSGKMPPDILMDREFADWNGVSAWAKDAVNKLTMQGIINGKPGNLFDPKGEATRAEFAAILHRFLKAVN